MKTEAPDKIYLADFTDTTEPVFYAKRDNTHDTDIEYTRTDAFIEKACEWLKNNIEKYYYLDEAYDKVISIKNLNNDFKNYMKGE